MISHPICDACFRQRGTGQVVTVDNAGEDEKCCWCASFTETGLHVMAPDDEVPGCDCAYVPGRVKNVAEGN